jgi:hypothetical protein
VVGNPPHALSFLHGAAVQDSARFLCRPASAACSAAGSSCTTSPACAASAEALRRSLPAGHVRDSAKEGQSSGSWVFSALCIFTFVWLVVLTDPFACLHHAVL